jgi:hypothetical protein
MNNRTRASAFGPVPDLDISGFAPKPRPDAMAPEPAKVREISEAAKFPSREAAPAKPKKAKRAPRIYRTGRNVQFNLKASQAAIDAFYELCDGQGWVMGVTFERAIAALQRELASEKPAAAGQGTDR